MASYAEPEAADAQDEGDRSPPANPADLSRNLVSRKDCPHRKILKVWKARLAYSDAEWKENDADWVEFLAVYERDNAAEAGKTEVQSGEQAKRDVKFSGGLISSNTHKLISFFNNQNPIYSCGAAKGEQFEALAKATEKLGATIAREMDYRSRNSLVFFEGFGRNHGFLLQTWDHYRWLPGWEYCEGDVRYDPDSNGDLEKAKFIFVKRDVDLDSVLDDPAILERHKKELREKRDCHRLTRGKGWSKKNDAPEDGATWDNVAGLERVTLITAFSDCGVLPPGAFRSQDGEGESDSDRGIEQGMGVSSAGRELVGGTAIRSTMSNDELARRTPHMNVYRAPPEIPEDAPPQAPKFDPLEHGQRVVITWVDGYDKILKVTPWPMDHYDRGEWPIIEFKPSRPPNSLHGVSMYRLSRPYARCMNQVWEHWINVEKHGGRRIVEYDKDLPDNEKRKLDSGNLYSTVGVEAGQVGRSFALTEFAPRATGFKELIPALQQEHDDTTGINDAVSGNTPDQQETATAATQRMDQALAALGYIKAEVHRFVEEQARLTIAAAQRYIPRESTYAPCPQCAFEDGITEDGLPALDDNMEPERRPILGEDGEPIPRGTGMMAAPPMPQMMPPQTDPLGLAPPPQAPTEVPCATCGVNPRPFVPTPMGNGWDPQAFAQKKRLTKGADAWLSPEDAGVWVDTLPVEDIRAEITVQVRQDSTQENYREREVAKLKATAEVAVPIYQAVGGPIGLAKWNTLVKAIMEATGIQDPKRFIFTDEELQQAAQMAAAAAAPPPPEMPPGPPPEQVQAEQQKAAQEQERAQADMGMKQAEYQHRVEMDQRKMALEEQGAEAAAMPHAKAADGIEQTLTVLTQGIQASLAAITQTVAGLAQVVQGVQAGAVADAQATQALAMAAQGLQASSAAVVQAAGAMEAAALAPKRIVRDAAGKVAGVETEAGPVIQ